MAAAGKRAELTGEVNAETQPKNPKNARLSWPIRSPRHRVAGDSRGMAGDGGEHLSIEARTWFRIKAHPELESQDPLHRNDDRDHVGVGVEFQTQGIEATVLTRQDPRDADPRHDGERSLNHRRIRRVRESPTAPHHVNHGRRAPTNVARRDEPDERATSALRICPPLPASRLSSMSVASDAGGSSVRGQRLPRRERRAQLLDAAREVFVASGFHAAGMDDIAEAAEVSKPVLYQHFPGKLDLYLALLDESSQALIASVDTALASTADNKLRVAATVQAYFDFVDDPGGAFRLIFESDLTNEAAVRERVDRTNDGCARRVSKVIAEDTGLTPDEAMLLAAGLVGLAQTAARHWLREEGRLPKDEAARLVSTLGWRGISRIPLSHPPT